MNGAAGQTAPKHNAEVGSGAPGDIICPPAVGDNSVAGFLFGGGNEEILIVRWNGLLSVWWMG